MKGKRHKAIAGFILLAFLVGMSIRWVANLVRQADLDHELLVAINKENTLAVASLLKQGANPNVREVPAPQFRNLRQFLNLWWHPVDPKLYPTALMYATAWQNYDIVK